MTALLGFVFLGLFSPGPNVILLTTSGARFGFRPTLPHLFGVVVGVGVTAFVTGLGLGLILTAMPVLKYALMGISFAWILWMAWGLWTSEPTRRTGRDRPFTFVEAVLFQWVNVKVWAVAVAAMAYVADLSPVAQGVRLGLVFSGLNLIVCLFWTFAGSLLTQLLQNPVAWRIFMRGMAVALVFFSVLVFR